jgi:hypothetical protein
MRIATVAVVATLAAALNAAMGRAQDSRTLEFFEAKIRPVLVEQCYSCHSAAAEKDNKLRGGLRLDTRAGLIKGGDHGPVVVPKSAASSKLISALQHQALKMPPSGKLPDAVIANFIQWVDQGALDPRDGKAVAAPVAVEKGRDFWAFQEPRLHPQPKVKQTDWPRKELDWFVLAARESRGLKPVAPASKAEWLRRATLDLTGLPPTPEEIDVFDKDNRPDADARVVDRLLASPQYGERWGRYWLDLARYTNDFGGTVDPVQAPEAYRYRDWVIQAFNRDIGYDQFIRLQLAGDLMTEPATDYEERLIGLGFQGLGQKFSGNATGMEKMKVADELDDRVDTACRGLLGLTVSCARCHDHKFDPIPTSDYYSLAAAYNGAQWNFERRIASPQAVSAFEQWTQTLADRKKEMEQIAQPEGTKIGLRELRRIDRYLLTAWKIRVLAQKKIKIDEQEIARYEQLNPLILSRWVTALTTGKPALTLMANWNTAADKATKAALATAGDVDAPSELIEQGVKLAAVVADACQELERIGGLEKVKTLSSERNNVFRSFLLFDGTVYRLSAEDAVPFLNPEQRKRYDEIAADVQRLTKAQPPTPQKAFSVNGGGQAMQINVRGNPEQLGETATPGFLRILRPPYVGLSRPTPTKASVGLESPTYSKTFTRLDLANSITDRHNPLTARVWVNRVWHYHFGRGIVGTLGNFGQLGDRPTHPELLDTLAVRFMDSGWSTKWLHREIMLSAAYRASCVANAANLAIDPDNVYLWRTSPRRLDFEAWRDSMLAVSGTLDARIGGPPKDGAKELHPDDPANHRRTIYCFISRFKPNPTLTLFDFPEPNVTSDRRNVTTIPQQQLFALNSPFVIAAAKAFAARIEKQEKDEDARIRLAWRLAFGRLPEPREIELSHAFLHRPTEPKSQMNPWQQLCHSLFAANEFAFLN